jgi:hypothetical protein
MAEEFIRLKWIPSMSSVRMVKPFVCFRFIAHQDKVNTLHFVLACKAFMAVIPFDSMLRNHSFVALPL